MESHIITEIGIRLTNGDPALYLWKRNGNFSGVSGMYIEDLLSAEDKEFLTQSEGKLNVFEDKPRPQLKSYGTPDGEK